jgi:hypothetical protein
LQSDGYLVWLSAPDVGSEASRDLGFSLVMICKAEVYQALPFKLICFPLFDGRSPLVACWRRHGAKLAG